MNVLDVFPPAQEFVSEAFSFNVGDDQEVREEGEREGEGEGRESVVMANSKCGTFSAVAMDCTLAVVNKSGPEHDKIICEVDFDHVIQEIAWDFTSQCIVIGDASGCLHLVTKDGTVLFSKNLSGKTTFTSKQTTEWHNDLHFH